MASVYTTNVEKKGWNLLKRAERIMTRIVKRDHGLLYLIIGILMTVAVIAFIASLVFALTYPWTLILSGILAMLILLPLSPLAIFSIMLEAHRQDPNHR